MDETLITVRLDVLTGGLNAMQALLLALVETHPEPERLAATFGVFLERMTAFQLASTWSDGVSQATQSLAQQFLEQALIHRGSGGPPPA